MPPHLTAIAIIYAIVTLAAAQITSVTNVMMPIAGQLPLTGTIIGQSNGIRTLAVHDCTTSSASCVLYSPITFTAGPSTYHFDGTGHWEILGEYDCAISGTTEAVCDVTIGDYATSDLIAMSTAAGDVDAWITTPASTSVSARATFRGEDARSAFREVTITGGPEVTAISTSGSGSGSGNGQTNGAVGSGAGVRTSWRFMFAVVALVGMAVPMVFL